MVEHASHRFVEANGIKIHLAEMGSGPAVILLHGFPETWYNWRFQLKALADAGFHAIAPDLRGFGLTECPKDSFGQFKNTPVDIVGDIVGLIQALGGEPVFLVGHDVGSMPGWSICRMRPDLIKGYVAIGIPPMERLRFPPQEGYYVNRFGVPGRAERDFSRFDIETVLRKVYTLFSRSDPEQQIAAPDEEILDLVKPDDAPPSWFTDEFVRVQAELYSKSGFEAPLWFTYRDILRKLELLSPWFGTRVSTPCLYITGEDDYVWKNNDVKDYVMNGGLKSDCPNLDKIVTLPGGHFVEEDSPDEVNSHILSFFKKLL